MNPPRQTKQGKRFLLITTFIITLLLITTINAANTSATCYLVTSKGFFYDPQCDRIPDSATACESGHGLIPDYDCDHVNDWNDNCPFVYNPYQLDYEGDGIGDACAGFVPPRTHALFYTHYQNFMHDFMEEYAGLLERYEQTLIAAASTTSPTFPLPTPNEAQNYPPPELQALQEQLKSLFRSATLNVIIDILDEQDAMPGESVVFPMKLTNQDTKPHTATITLSNLSPHATFRVEPKRTITLKPQSTTYASVHVALDHNAPLGTYEPVVYLDVDGQKTSAPLRLNAYEYASKARYDTATGAQGFLTILAAIFVFILIIIVLLLLLTRKKKEPDMPEDIDEYLAREGL
ncbi:hypothetical protein D6783_05080 [Candidatus Woesearchaeota archaeon]|nr:MAG: hypothetical protein D6783_05080 [Candidatus Woesearchaeota archaeon]